MLKLQAYDSCVPTFGDTLRAARDRAELSQEKLAKLLGQGKPSTVQSWESGRRLPRRSSIQKLAEALGVLERDLTGASDLPRDAYADGDSRGVAAAIKTIRTADRDLQAWLVRLVLRTAREYAKSLPSSPRSESPHEIQASTAASTSDARRRAGRGSKGRAR